jgi:hypothetical protein
MHGLLHNGRPTSHNCTQPCLFAPGPAKSLHRTLQATGTLSSHDCTCLYSRVIYRAESHHDSSGRCKSSRPAKCPADQQTCGQTLDNTCQASRTQNERKYMTAQTETAAAAHKILPCDNASRRHRNTRCMSLASSVWPCASLQVSKQTHRPAVIHQVVP